MSGSYYCHECEERISHVLTPLDSCSICGCNYIEEIPTVIEEDFNRQVDLFCNYSSILSQTSNHFQVIHEEEDDDDDDEELLEERCLYEQISSIYNHPAARNIPGPSQRIDEILGSDNDDEEEEEQDILAYDVLFEQRENDGSTNIFQLPFARIGRLLESDEESEDGDDYHRRSFLDNLADILSDFTQDIETTSIPSANSPSIDLILSSFKKKYLIATDSDVGDECIICQDTFGTTLEVFHLPCHHQFHGACISRWLYIKLSCPICRQSVYDAESISGEQVEPTIEISNDRYMMNESVEEVD
ncbi:hypothetical protein HPULCUR_005022 [Helicostylum pulchrum]|uniref:RING-type domain-containing protein n=1 Tax=Helicostylum pulchrum TaxID=562976 RepID=A0ABP9XXW0_9FUNG